jgi:hypothetical protein
MLSLALPRLESPGYVVNSGWSPIVATGVGSGKQRVGRGKQRVGRGKQRVGRGKQRVGRGKQRPYFLMVS